MSFFPAEEEEDGDEGEVDVGAAAPPVHRRVAAGRPEEKRKREDEKQVKGSVKRDGTLGPRPHPLNEGHNVLHIDYVF